MGLETYGLKNNTFRVELEVEDSLGKDRRISSTPTKDSVVKIDLVSSFRPIHNVCLPNKEIKVEEGEWKRDRGYGILWNLIFEVILSPKNQY